MGGRLFVPPPAIFENVLQCHTTLRPFEEKTLIKRTCSGFEAEEFSKFEFTLFNIRGSFSCSVQQRH